MTTPPPGWYDDGHGAVRWWDGASWTPHVQAPPTQIPGAQFASEQTPKPKSRLWILWVSLGVVVVAIVAAAVVLVPMIVSVLTAGPSVVPQDDDERAALTAIDGHNDAWLYADCDLYEEVTTADFRSRHDLEDCATFEDQARAFSDLTEDFTYVVTDIDRDDDAIIIETRESYLVTRDDAGNPLETPESMSEDTEYVVIDDGGTWRIDEWE